MKITIVLGAFLPVPPVMGGAVEKVWFALGQEFARRGHEVVQISRAMPDLPARETIGGVTHVRVRGYDTPASLVQLKLLDFFYSLGARRALPEKSDVIVTNTFWLPMLLRNERRGKVYVHAARFPKGQMRFYSHCARVQAPSSAVAEAIVAEAPSLAPKVIAIPNPRPDPNDLQLPPFDERARVILYAGRLHPEKGVHLLIEAFTQLQPEIRRDWTLRLIGPWESRHGGGGPAYHRQLEALASGGVELRQPVFDAAALEQEFRRARLFVYPSLAERGESFGLAPLEAMTYGCAVLVSQLGCFRDFIAEGATGFFFDHRAASPAAALREKIAALLGDEPRLAAVAERGRARSDEFSLGRVAEKYLEDFQLLTHGAGNPP